MSSPRSAVLAALSVGALAVGATGAFASYDTGGSTDTRNGSPGAFRAASYINGDAGANPNVDPNSSCFNRDQFDYQRISTRASGNPGNRNVHNDACFLDMNNNKADGPASFQSFGTGYISACPDPDGAGEKYAVLRDTNGDGRDDLCFQSGYQETGAPGDDEFHARMNKNKGDGGRQRVVWCSDADADGCTDEDVKDQIKIKWFRPSR
ncbi:MAG: hypothetical protein H0V02_08170 [Nocardioidaceae bacterium]|nr:hypothetical protein [Nocardioidaceae bacterium]